MPDVLDPYQRHRNMAAIHSSSTKPELKLRRALWRIGFRYRVNDKKLPGKPDVVLPKYRTVIFVHGCFWHGHKDCKYYAVPKTNTDFWIAKVSRNQKRDQEVWRKLEARGWSVIIVWECQLKRQAFDGTLARVQSEIIHNGDAFRQFQYNRRIARLKYQQECRARKERESALLADINRNKSAIHPE